MGSDLREARANAPYAIPRRVTICGFAPAVVLQSLLSRSAISDFSGTMEGPLWSSVIVSDFDDQEGYSDQVLDRDLL